MTPEAKVARVFRDAIKSNGGWCIKVSGVGMRGLPDYLVIFPRGYIALVELKALGGELTALQERMIENLRNLGCDVRVVYGEDGARYTARELRINATLR